MAFRVYGPAGDYRGQLDRSIDAAALVLMHLGPGAQVRCGGNVLYDHGQEPPEVVETPQDIADIIRDRHDALYGGRTYRS